VSVFKVKINPIELLGNFSFRVITAKKMAKYAVFGETFPGFRDVKSILSPGTFKWEYDSLTGGS